MIGTIGIANILLARSFDEERLIITAVKPRALALGIQHWLLTAMLS